MKRLAFFIAALSVVFSVKCGYKPVIAQKAVNVIGENGVYELPVSSGKDGFLCDVMRLDEEIDLISMKEDVAPKDAYIKFSPDKKKKFQAVREVAGRRVDRQKLKDDILSALSVGGGAIGLVFEKVWPRVKVKDLDLNVVERALFSTPLGSSSAERITNIKLAARAINGTVLNAGEQFSFNDTVGKRSESKGYKSAKVISDGAFTEGVGGGVCQVSTTLYNAALLSGLEIDEFHPHSLAVSYVENSFDAMVSYGVCDLKFTNGGDTPVFIAAHVEGERLIITIYGSRSEFTFERESVVLEEIKAKVKTVVVDTLHNGESNVKSYPKDGVKSAGYLIKKRGGKVVSRTLLRKDEYKAVDGVTEVGEGGAAGAAQ